MCDNDSFDDMLEYRLRREVLSRRTFGSLSLGAGLASLLPVGCKASDAAPAPPSAPSTAVSGAAPAATPAPATTESEVTIATPDGTCDAYFVHPASGAAPAVLVWPDIFGLRPAFRQMGKRLAEAGYAAGRWGRRATAWAARSSCAPRRRARSASARRRRSTAAVS